MKKMRTTLKIANYWPQGLMKVKYKRAYNFEGSKAKKIVLEEKGRSWNKSGRISSTKHSSNHK